eukprot:572771-Rhodomonas_salina.1
MRGQRTTCHSWVCLPLSPLSPPPSLPPLASSLTLLSVERRRAGGKSRHQVAPTALPAPFANSLL